MDCITLMSCCVIPFKPGQPLRLSSISSSVFCRASSISDSLEMVMFVSVDSCTVRLFS